MIEPSGDSFGYFGAAAGKGKQVAKTEVEKLDLENLTAREAIVKVWRNLDPIDCEGGMRGIEWLARI